LGANTTSHRIALEVPGNVFTDVPARVILIPIKKLDQQLGVTPEGLRYRTESRLDAEFFAPECRLKITE
jgi:hypothetical protein